MTAIKTIFLATRPQFLPPMAVAVALGASVARHETGSMSLPLLALTIVAALLCHAGMNVLNDYYDFKNNADNLNTKALTPFTGGSRFIQRGLLTPGFTLALGSALVLAGALVGLLLAFAAGPLLIAVGLAGLASGYFYSAPPVFLAGRGLGELAVGANFGVLAVLGSYLVQTGGLSLAALVASLPMALLIAGVLFVNSFPDAESDEAAGKRTLVVRLGPARGRYGLIVMLALAYASIAAGVALGLMPRASAAAVVTALPAAYAAAGLMRHYDGGARLIPSIKALAAAHLATGALLTLSNLI